MSEGCAQDGRVIPDDKGYILMGLVKKVDGKNVLPLLKEGAFGKYLEDIECANICERCFGRMPHEEVRDDLNDFNSGLDVYALQSNSWHPYLKTHLLGCLDDDEGPAERKLRFISGGVAREYFPKALEMVAQI